MNYLRRSRVLVAIGALLVLVLSSNSGFAQGVTTASIAGVVSDAQGAVVPGVVVVAVHEPSGTTYEATPRLTVASSFPACASADPTR